MVLKEISEKASSIEINIVKLECELGLFKNFVGKDVQLKLCSSINTASTNGKVINLNPKSSCILNNYGARALLQHEEAHILFKSMPVKIKSKLSKVHPNYAYIIPKLYGIVEDYRVENLWQHIFPGSVSNFNHLYSGVIRSIEKSFKKNDTSDPLDALYIARLGVSGSTSGLERIISDELRPTYIQFINELKKLEGKDYIATYTVVENILHFFKPKSPPAPNSENAKDGFKALSSTSQPGIGLHSDIQQQSEEEYSSSDSSSNSTEKGHPSPQSRNSEANKGINDNSKNSHQQHNGKILKMDPTFTDELNATEDDGSNTKEAQIVLSNISNKSESEILKESGKRLAVMLKDLDDPKNFTAISNLNREITLNSKDFNTARDPKNHILKNGSSSAGVTLSSMIITKYDNGIDHYSGPRIKPSPEIKAQLERIRMGIERCKWEAARNGNRLNIKNIVRGIATKDPIYTERQYFKQIEPGGVKFIMMLDLSGSMSGHKINIAKNVLGTIYDSVQGSTLVKMRMFGFYGSTPHVSEFGRKQLMQLNADGSTPTAEALSYINTSGLLRNGGSTQYDTIVILITDGIPNSDNDTKSALKELMARQGMQVFTIFISSESDYESEKETITNIFSPSTALYHIQSIGAVKSTLENIVSRDLSRRAEEYEIKARG